MWDKDQFKYLAKEIELELEHYDKCVEGNKKRMKEIVEALKLLDKLLNYPKGRSEQPESPESDEGR